MEDQILRYTLDARGYNRHSDEEQNRELFASYLADALWVIKEATFKKGFQIVVSGVIVRHDQYYDLIGIDQRKATEQGHGLYIDWIDPKKPTLNGMEIIRRAD